MSTQGTRACPNCGLSIEDAGATLCPNCGATLPPLTVMPPPVSAPPPVSGTEPPLPPVPGGETPPPPPLRTSEPPLPILVGPSPSADSLITKIVWLDMTLGILTVFISMGLYGLGIITSPILYFLLRDKKQAFARGIKYGGLALLILIGGTFLICTGFLFTGKF